MSLDKAKLSPSIAKILIDESPKHAWTVHRQLGNRPRPTTDAAEKGKIIHALLLDESDKIVIVEADSFRSNAAKAERDAARATGLIPVVSKKIDDYRGIVDSIKADLFERSINLDDYESEVLVEWEETAADGTEVKCKGYIDLLHRNKTKIIDVKTLPSGRADPELCAGRLLKTNGIYQSRGYVRAVEFLYPEIAGRVSMEFYFCELTDPFDICPIYNGATMEEIAVLRWERAVEKWARCITTNKWPGFGEQGAVRVEAPGWALAKELEADL